MRLAIKKSASGSRREKGTQEVGADQVATIKGQGEGGGQRGRATPCQPRHTVRGGPLADTGELLDPLGAGAGELAPRRSRLGLAALEPLDRARGRGPEGDDND